MCHKILCDDTHEIYKSTFEGANRSWEELVQLNPDTKSITEQPVNNLVFRLKERMRQPR